MHEFEEVRALVRKPLVYSHQGFARALSLSLAMMGYGTSCVGSWDVGLLFAERGAWCPQLLDDDRWIERSS